MQRNFFWLISMVLLAIFIIPQIGFADDEEEEVPFLLGDPVAEGNGCPEGSYSVVLSPDGNELSILFSAFTAMTDEENIYDFSNCNIAIPIDVEPGISIGLAGIDYRGLSYIPTGGVGMLYREYFFAGAQGPMITSSVNVFDQYYNFFYSDDFEFVIWTECGDDVIARSNATIFAFRPYTSDIQALMTVFSEDWDVSIKFHLTWQPCTEGDDDGGDSLYSIELK